MTPPRVMFAALVGLGLLVAADGTALRRLCGDSWFFPQPSLLLYRDSAVASETVQRLLGGLHKRRDQACQERSAALAHRVLAQWEALYATVMPEPYTEAR